jgi:integrase
VTVIPIPKFLVDELTAHLAEFGVGEQGLLFTDDDGRLLRRSRFSEKVWRPAVIKAKAREGTVFHDLRHYYAILLIRSGASVKTVQTLLGHSSVLETLDTYSHLWPDSDDHTREAVEKELAGAVLHNSEDSVRTIPGHPG